MGRMVLFARLTRKVLRVEYWGPVGGKEIQKRSGEGRPYVDHSAKARIRPIKKRKEIPAETSPALSKLFDIFPVRESAAQTNENPRRSPPTHEIIAVPRSSVTITGIRKPATATGPDSSGRNLDRPISRTWGR